MDIACGVDGSGEWPTLLSVSREGVVTEMRGRCGRRSAGVSAGSIETLRDCTPKVANTQQVHGCSGWCPC